MPWVDPHQPLESTSAVVWGTVSGLGAWMGKDLSTDTRATLALEAGRVAVIGWIGYDPRAVITDTATFSGRDSTWVVPALPIEEVTSIVVDGVALATTDYSWTAQGIITRTLRSSFSSSTVSTAVVTYSHGWDPVPDALIALLYEATALILDDTPGPIVSETLGSWSTTYAQNPDEYGLSQSARSIIDQYRLWIVAY
jgi:hypothetical protein